MVTDLGVFSDIPDRGGKCQKPRDTKSPPQAHRMMNLLSGSQASATSFPLQHVVCSSTSWRQGPVGFALRRVGMTQPRSLRVLCCPMCGDCQVKRVVPAAPCFPACSLPAIFSSGSAHLLLFILLTFVQKTTSVFCSEENTSTELTL